MANNSGTATGTNGEEVTSSNQKEDVYEFKTSSKEATPTSSRGSASPGNAGENGGEKRPAAAAEGDEDDTAANKKRKKADESSGSGGSNAGSGSNGRGRGVRGNSSDKGGGKQGGRGRGSAAGGSSGSSNAERRSPPVRGDNSPAPSPGKGKQPKNEQLNSGANGGAGGESDDDGDKKEGGLKVPPLKIVLNNGSNNRDEDKKKGSYIVNNTDEQEGGEGGATKPGGDSEQTSSGEEKSSGSRVTRSRGGGNEDDGPSESQTEEDRKQTNEYVLKKRKVRSQQEEPAAMGNGITRPSGEPLTDLEKHLNIRKQIEQRRKNLFPVQPKPPHGFRDYLMNKKTYHLQGNTGKDSRIQPIPKIAPPPSLDGPFRELFLVQENERYKLRMKHLVEKEKLVLAVEQEILRVHGRAARALANQSLPYSVCTILRDREIYTTIDPNQEENRDIRSRYFF